MSWHLHGSPPYKMFSAKNGHTYLRLNLLNVVGRPQLWNTIFTWHLPDLNMFMWGPTVAYIIAQLCTTLPNVASDMQITNM